MNRIAYDFEKEKTVSSRITQFYQRFHVGEILRKCNAYKEKGTPSALTYGSTQGLGYYNGAEKAIVFSGFIAKIFEIRRDSCGFLSVRRKKSSPRRACRLIIRFCKMSKSDALFLYEFSSASSACDV